MAKSFVLSDWARPEMLALSPYTSARDTFTATEGEWTFLDANENPNATAVNRYPDPNQSELKKVIANLRGCNENQLLLGNGSDEVLDLIFRAFCAPYKDEIIIMPPTYGMYKVLANINSVGLIEVPLDADFQLQPEGARAAHPSGPWHCASRTCQRRVGAPSPPQCLEARQRLPEVGRLGCRGFLLRLVVCRRSWLAQMLAGWPDPLAAASLDLALRVAAFVPTPTVHKCLGLD